MTTLKPLFFLFILSTTTFFSSQAQYSPGQIYFGVDSFIEYRAGDLPIIVSAPHGGYLEPVTIPDRNCSGCVTGRDSRTEEMAYELDSAVKVVFGGHPHVIVNKLARIKLDANREIVEAAQGNTQAEAAWYEYHQFIQAAKDSAIAEYGTALFIDLHGHGHTIQRIELGYLLSRSELQLPNTTLNSQDYQDSTAIKHLFDVQSPPVDFSELLRGSDCLGELLVDRGYATVPSATDTAPAGNDPYFNGGYNTRRHGSKDSSAVNAVQFELNWDDVRDSRSNRKLFARGCACALRSYFDTWFFDLDSWDPGNLVTSTLDEGPGTLREALLGAEDGDVITFDPALNGDTIRLNKELQICADVVIQGPGPDQLAVSGEGMTRIIRVMPADSLTISGLSLVNGRSPSGEDGGAFTVQGKARVVNCHILNNHAGDDGGGINVPEFGKVWLDSSLVSGNTCEDDGAGLRCFDGELYLHATEVSQNISPSWGGGLSNNGLVEIDASTFSANEAVGNGGAIRTFGGSVHLVNSTLAGNIAGYRGAGISSDAYVQLDYCTVVWNQAASLGGGMRILSDSCQMNSTLVAENSGLDEPDVSEGGGIIHSWGYNLIGDSTGSSWAIATGDQLGDSINPIDAQLLPLGNNGGATPTVSFDPGSPAQEQGDMLNAPVVDQRGIARPQGNAPDIGAFEWDPPIANTNPSPGNFRVYPNPAQDKVTIQFDQQGNYQLSLRNTMGQEVGHSTISGSKRNILNLQGLPAGTYFVIVKGDLTGHRVIVKMGK